jgi:hypothetical protein
MPQSAVLLPSCAQPKNSNPMEKKFLSTDYSSIMVCQWLVVHFGQYIYPSKMAATNPMI